MTFGIPSSLLPLDEEGEPNLSRHWNYLEERKATEEESKRKAAHEIGAPTSIDVVLGRGKPFQEYPGNLRLQEIIEKHWSRYQVADRFEKTVITMEIVTATKSSGGRFLKKDGDSWILVDDTVAKDRVSHSCRNITQKKRKQDYKNFWWPFSQNKL
jgi:hypothetical protein